MKVIYMMLSGLILSIMATLAMAGLISVSELIRPQTVSQKPMTSKMQSAIHVTKKDYAHYQQLPEDCHDTPIKKVKSVN